MSGVPVSQALARTRDLELAWRAAVMREQELEQVNDRLRRGYQLALDRAIDFKRTCRRLERSVVELLIGVIQAMESRHGHTLGHSARVGALARRLALKAGLTRSQAETIAQAGQLHDLGKLVVPEALLTRSGPMDERERALVRRHSVIGAQLVAPLDCLAEVAMIVRHHHERHDGGGYPDGLRRETIPLGARIIAVADRYDALISPRAYRPALGLAAATERLRLEAGHALDPELTALFLAMLADDGDPPRPSSLR